MRPVMPLSAITRECAGTNRQANGKGGIRRVRSTQDQFTRRRRSAQLPPVLGELVRIGVEPHEDVNPVLPVGVQLEANRLPGPRVRRDCLVERLACPAQVRFHDDAEALAVLPDLPERRAVAALGWEGSQLRLSHNSIIPPVTDVAGDAGRNRAHRPR